MSSILSAKLRLQLSKFTLAIQFVFCIYHLLTHDAVGPVNDDRLLRRVSGVASDCITSGAGSIITSVIVVILPAPLVYTATMFDALVEAAKRTTACREYGKCVEGNNNMGKYV